MTRFRGSCGGYAQFLAAVVLLGGCGGGGDGGTTSPPAAVSTITVTLASATITVGQTSQATAQPKDAQGTVLTGRAITWASSNESVASVSSSGLVTGVAAGTASISATSEGKTGQASITVDPPPITQPVVSNVSVTQNGQAANLSNVVGKLSISATLTLPSGYSGDLVLRIDTVEFHRTPVSAPALSGRLVRGTADPIVVTTDHAMEANTARTTFVVTQDQIDELPLLTNRNYQALINVIPTGSTTPSTSQSVNLTTNNPSYARGFVAIDGMPVTGTDGKTYTGGLATAAVTFALFNNEAISGFEVGIAPSGAEYGRSTGGVVNFIQKVARTDRKKFTFPTALVEQPDLALILNSVTIDGVTIDPQATYFGSTEYTTDAIGTGFANTLAQSLQFPVVAPKRFFLVDPPPPDLLTGVTVVRGGIDAFHLDNVGPTQSSAPDEPVFQLLDRMTTVGGAARYPTWGFGGNDGQVGRGYDLAAGFHPERLADVSDLDLTKTTFYGGLVTDRPNLFSSQFEISSDNEFAESNGARNYTAGVRVVDKRGNSSDWSLHTSLGNRWRLDGQLSASVGLDEAAFGYSRTRADLAVTGPPSESVWNRSTLDASLRYTWNASNSVVGLPDGWLSARAKFNDTWLFGAGAQNDQYEVLPSQGGLTSGAAEVLTDAIMDQMIGEALGVDQGLFQFDFKAADNAGRYVQDWMYPRQYSVLRDYLGPTGVQITYNGAVTPGAIANATLSGMDNFAIRRAWLGVRFAFASALFFGGQVFVPLGVFDIPGTLLGPRTNVLSLPIAGTVPLGFSFFNPFSGTIDNGNFYPSNGGSLQLMDMAWNLSAIAFAPYTPSGVVPAFTNVSHAFASQSTSNWCPGTCAAGGTSTPNLEFSYRDTRSTGTPMISKAAWFAIASGIVYPLGHTTTFTEEPDAGGRRIRFPMTPDLLGYCGPSGTVAVFVIGYSADGLYLLKVNPFFSAVIRVPNPFSNRCRLAA